jgi:hypothetical protein
MLLAAKIQMDLAWEPANKPAFFRIYDRITQKVTFTFGPKSFLMYYYGSINVQNTVGNNFQLGGLLKCILSYIFQQHVSARTTGAIFRLKFSSGPKFSLKMAPVV